MSPELDYRARDVVRTAAQAYLSPSFDTTNSPNVMDLAEERGLAPDYTDFIKIGRYAVAAASIHLLMDEAVKGIGAAAQFVDGHRVTSVEQKPKYALSANVVANFQAAADRLRKPETSLYEFLMRCYVVLSKQDEHAFSTGQASFIDQGGTLGLHGANFVSLSAQVLAASPETGALDAAHKTAIAHELTSVVTGKASKHLNHVNAGTSWYDHSVENTVLVQRGKAHALRQSGGGTLFRAPPAITAQIKRYGPLIKCPAHQLLFSDETALQSGAHAVINLGAERGFYG